jgi:cysteine synthase
MAPFDHVQSAPVSQLRVGNSVLDVIGQTPLVRLNRFGSGVAPAVYAKLESMNPSGSMKDRAAVSMIEEAEATYGLRPGSTIIVATSGNMGLAMAMVCAVKGFRLICVVDPKISPSTERTLRLYGATVVKVYQRDQTGGYHLTRLDRVAALQAEYPAAVYLDQYDSPANVAAHQASTGPEILEALEGCVRAVVLCAGTGGSSMGVARFFREHSPQTEIWLVDEYGSLALPGNHGPAPRHLNGMGTSIAPANYDPPSFDQVVDHVVFVHAAEAIQAAVDLARSEGILAGGTGGAVLHVLRDIAAAAYDSGDNLVAVLPDHGSRYSDTQFDKEWLSLRGIDVPQLFADDFPEGSR